MSDEFVCAACGERHHGKPYRVFVDVTVGRIRGRSSPSCFSRDDTYEVYCKRCAYGIAMYITRRAGLQKLNRGLLTDRAAKARAECRMAEIGRRMWDTEIRRRQEVES